MSISSHLPLSRLDIRVYYEDTDAAGVVFYANYLKFFERARTEWLRRLGVTNSELALRDQRMFVVKSVAIQYRQPARLDDMLVIDSRITHLGRASITFDQTAMRDGELLCESTIQVCGVNTVTFKPAAMPVHLRNLLEKAQK
ncbi:MAG: tol-pal system-associated acyl-CoA thioesterase [Burkholderiaceae bacterium]|nr:tol-pal system-associated acyl-CoA thioesterase [Burkholderiaceae bacterium]